MNMNIDDMRAAAGQASSLMGTLSNPNRLMMLCMLVDGEKSVSELVDQLEMRQANVSQQLALMRKEGLVTTRREGQTIYYSLNGDEAAQVIELLYTLYCK